MTMTMTISTIALTNVLQTARFMIVIDHYLLLSMIWECINTHFVQCLNLSIIFLSNFLRRLRFSRERSEFFSAGPREIWAQLERPGPREASTEALAASAALNANARGKKRTSERTNEGACTKVNSLKIQDNEREEYFAMMDWPTLKGKYPHSSQSRTGQRWDSSSLRTH